MALHDTAEVLIGASDDTVETRLPRRREPIAVSDLSAAELLLRWLGAAGFRDRTLTVLARDTLLVSWR